MCCKKRNTTEVSRKNRKYLLLLHTCYTFCNSGKPWESKGKVKM